MSDLVCHPSPKGGIDDRIAAIFNKSNTTKYTKEDIGALRGLYDQESTTPLVKDDGVKENEIEDIIISDAANKLASYIKSREKRHKAELKDSTKHMAKSFSKLYHVKGWNAQTRLDRINAIAAEFTAEVSKRLRAAQKEGHNVTREEVANGYKVLGKRYNGQFSIFEAIFDKFFAKYKENLETVEAVGYLSDAEFAKLDAETKQEYYDTLHDVEEYGKILANWAPLCAFARMQLRNTEGLKLGNSLEYASPVTSDNLSSEESLDNTFELEESVREAWQELTSQISAYGSAGTEVRRFLATISALKYGEKEGTIEKVRDDLGYVRRLDPLSTHQLLADVLRGATSESSMLKRLREGAENDLTLKAVYDALSQQVKADLSIPIGDNNRPKNPTLLTQFLVDMHKNMVLYSALKRAKEGIKNVYANILNRRHNPLHEQYLLNLETYNGENLSEPPIYYTNQFVSTYNRGKAGLINWESLVDWYVQSEQNFPSAEKAEDSKESESLFDSPSNTYGTGFWAKGYGTQNRINYLLSASSALGISMTKQTAENIVRDKNKLSKYTRTLQRLREQMMPWALGTKERRADFKRLTELYKKQALGNNTTEEASEYRGLLQKFKEWSENSTIDIKHFLTAKPSNISDSDSPGFGIERVNELLDVIASASIDLQVERGVKWYDRKGNTTTRFADVTPSYMGDMVDKIHSFVNDEDFKGLENYIMDKWGNNSFFYDSETGKFRNKWLQEFIDAARKGKVDQYSLAKVFNFVEFLGSDINGKSSLFENFSSKQHAQAMIKHFVMDRFGDKKSPLAKYPSFILGDSGVQRFFTAKRYDKSTLLDGFVEILRQEKERIKYIKAANEAVKADFAKKIGFTVEEGKEDGTVTVYDKDGRKVSDETLRNLGYHPIENISDTANEFTQLRFLNPDFQNGYYWKKITGKDKIPDSKAEAIQDVLDTIGTDVVKHVIEEYMDNALKEFKDRLVRMDILKYDKNTDTYSPSDNYFAQDVNLYNKDINALIEDFYWNTKYATIQQIQMFTVDPAFYDHRYPIKDLQKRYKEVYAPGKNLSLEAWDPYNNRRYTEDTEERVAYFDDIATNSEDVNPLFMEVIASQYGKNSPVYNAYKDNTLTDGQGYRTLESYRKVMGMSAQWTQRMEAAYKEIQQIRQNKQENEPLTKAEMERLSELAVIFQPIKPYMFTLEKVRINENDYALVPVQHKYAEVVLIPELMAEGKLKQMALWAERNNVDLLASTKCVKVGNFGATNLKEANTAESIEAALNKAYIHKLSWEDYRIQSGVPEHLNHNQLFGTQPRKLIFDSIDKGASYQRYLQNIFKTIAKKNGSLQIALPTKNGIEKVNLTGQTLIALYNSLIMGNMFDNFEEFASATASNQSLSDIMLQNIISNANQSEDAAFGLSIIEPGMEGAGEFLVPPGEPGMEHDAAALLNSLFKKMVNKQKIHGGSAVQASSMGIKGWDNSGELFEVVSPEKDNVLYDEIEIAFNVSYTSALGTKVNLKYEDWCNDDGTLKLADGKDGRPLEILYGEEAREYLSWPVSGRNEQGRPNQVDENGYDPNGYYKPLIERAYPGVLDIIAYRIPTEKEYSMINAKVFRFSRPELGGIMKVPSSRTTTAGFDFDIDKLYFFMREFAQTHLSDEQIENIWKDIYREHRDWQRALLDVREADSKVQESLKELSTLFYNSKLAGDIEKANENQGLARLYQYWEAAGLEGTPEEAFTSYLESHRDKYPIFDTYNPEVSPFNPVMDKKGNIITPGNTRVARNNLLIDLFRQRLMDKETLKARYTPGGFANNRAAALAMRVLQFVDKSKIIDRAGNVSLDRVNEYINSVNDKTKPETDPEPQYDYSDPTAILIYNQQNQVAAKLIGIFANQNTNHVYASILHKMQLKEAIKFGNHSTDAGLKDFLHAPEGVDVNTNVAEYLAASVDAVKDPVLNFLNLNEITADAGAMLARLGYTPLEIGLLFNQPIIKEVCEYAVNEGVGVDLAILNIANKYGAKDLGSIQYNSRYAETTALANNIVKHRESDNISAERDARFKTGQLHILRLFNDILADSKELSSFVQSTRFTAANSIGSTMGDYYAKEMRVQQFLNTYSSEGATNHIEYELFDKDHARYFGSVTADKAKVLENNSSIIRNNEDLLDLSPGEYAQEMMFNPLAFEQTMWDLYRKAVKKVFSKYFPFETGLYAATRNYLAELSSTGILNADTINSIHRDLAAFLLSSQTGSAFDGEAMNFTFGENNPISNRYYYSKVFPVMLHMLQSSNANLHPFLKLLQVTGNTKKGKGLTVKIPNIGSMRKEASNYISQLWSDAVSSEEMVKINSKIQLPVSKLAMDYYFYNFYKLAYDFHPTSGMSLAPTLLKTNLRIETHNEEMGYIDFVNNLINNDKPSSGERLKIFLSPEKMRMFAKQYILNHLDNYAFVFTAKGTALETLKNKIENADGLINDSFTLNASELGNSISPFVLRQTKDDIYFKPVIAIDKGDRTYYYMASGGNFNITSKENATMTYNLVTPLGKKGQSIQYFNEAAFREYQENLGNRDNYDQSINLDEQTDSVSDSSLEESPAVNPLVEVSPEKWMENISDAEWEQMTNIYNNIYVRSWQKPLSVESFKTIAKSETISIKVLEDLYRQIDRNNMKDLKTIDEEGNSIEACGV